MALGNSSMPECTRNALQPSTPARASPASSPALPGTTPPQKPTSTAQLARAGRELGLERRARGGDRQAVERHVDQRGHAAGRGGARRGREALPLGAARLVDVHVAVDQAGRDDHAIADVERASAPACGAARSICVDAAVAHRTGRRGPTAPVTTTRVLRHAALDGRAIRTPARRSRTGSQSAPRDPRRTASG